MGGDPVGPVADVGCGRLRDPTAPGLKHPVPARRHAVGVGTDEAVQGVVQRQHIAGPGFGEPARDHRLQACRLLLRQVVHFVEVLVQVVEFPPVGIEVGSGLVPGHRLPALVPEASVAEHLEVLGALSGGLGARIEGIGETRALDGLLGDAVDRGRCLDAGDLEHGGRDVADMVELVTDFAALPDARRPVHDERIPHPSAVGVLLVALERGVAGHGPAQGVVVVEVGLTDRVNVLQVLGQGVADAVEVAEGVHRAKGRALLAGAIVRDQGDQGVL